MPTSKAFTEAYKRLNKAQKEAVDTVEGPVMVVAGPGTGKTQILSLRIANILLKTDTAPSSILAIAFTDSAVKAMRKRLLTFIGARAYEIPIYTFHGFANDRIQEFPDAFPRIIGSEPISDIERIRIIEKILLEGDWKILRPSGDPLYYVRPVLSIIQSIKREGYDPVTFRVLIDCQQSDYDAVPDKIHLKGAYKGQMKAEYKNLQEKIHKNKELVEVFRLYEEALQKGRLYDYEDMILEMVRGMESNETFLRTLQERYQYVLVDEHQDTNGSQNKIVELLVSFHQNPNLFIVGDEKQAVYRFQGASLQNFISFKDRFVEAKVIHLEENYRSTQRILDASHGLIQKNTDISPQKLKSQDKHVHTINIVETDNEEAEAEYIALHIQNKLANVSAEEIAVIYRNNNDSRLIERALYSKAIPYTIQSNRGIFEDDDIARFIDTLEAIAHIEQEELLARVILFDFITTDFISTASIIQRAYKERVSLSKLLEKEMPEIWNTLCTLAVKAHNEPLRDSLELILHNTGFLSHIMEHAQSHDKAHKVRVLIQEAEELTKKNSQATLADFVVHVRTLIEHRISLSMSESSGIGVQLMTAHKSKGLEFEHVYIMGVYDGHWGNRRSMQKFTIPGIGEDVDHTIEDERRLFYVALTRAKKDIVISYPNHRSDGGELFPAQFIEEIDTEHVTRIKTDIQATFSKKDPAIDKRKEQYRTYIKKLFLEQGLNVTALNSYLDCPWKYFFRNLLRVPEIKSTPQLFGDAIHAAFKRLSGDIIKNSATEEKFIEYYIQALSRLPLPEREYEELKKKGEDILKRYYTEYKDSFNQNIRTEYSICCPLGETVIKGNIDKIEFNDHAMSVVDYKTGKSKTRNHIIGKTKGQGAGDYWRQLQFYKLLLDQSDLSKHYTFKEGIIDFVEPDEKGYFHKESFTISDEDIVVIKELITKVMQEIISLSFFSHECKDICEYCDLAKRTSLLKS